MREEDPAVDIHGSVVNTLLPTPHIGFNLEHEASAEDVGAARTVAHILASDGDPMSREVASGGRHSGADHLKVLEQHLRKDRDKRTKAGIGVIPIENFVFKFEIMTGLYVLDAWDRAAFYLVAFLAVLIAAISASTQIM